MLNYIANNFWKQNLINHNIAVGLLSKIFFKENFNNVEDLELLSVEVSAASFLHDIGKATKKFQNFLNKENSKEDNKKPYHNEISWAVAIHSQLKIDNAKLQRILWLMYHHHKPRPISFDKNNHLYIYESSQQIINSLTKNDIIAMNKYLEILTNKFNYLNTDHKMSFMPINTDFTNQAAPSVVDPFIYNSKLKGEESFNLLDGIEKLQQSALIYADRWISEFMSKEDVDEVVNNIPSHEELFKKHPKYPKTKVTTVTNNFNSSVTSRDLTQKLIIDKTLNKNFAIIDAPPGLGKTNIMLQWAAEKFKTGKHSNLIIVLPRNSTAENVYIGINRDMERTETNLSSCLFLSSTIMQSDGCISEDPFDFDVIVTNIDTLAAPYMKHSSLDRLINFCSDKYLVAFDEFHEIIQGNALPGLFRSFLLNRYSNKAPTILLSATPVDLSPVLKFIKPDFFITENSPVYDNDIQVFFGESIQECESYTSGKYALVCSTVDIAQNNCDILKDEIVHASYIPSEKDVIIKDVLTKFGKNGVGGKTKTSATRIIQSSLDVSWESIIETPQSPEGTIQVLGRLNRFDNSPGKLIFKTEMDGSEEFMASRVYSKKLTKAWIAFLQSRFNQGQIVKKSELYQARRDFLIKEDREIKKWLKGEFKDSYNKIKELEFLSGYTKIYEKQDPKQLSKMKKNLRESNGYHILVQVYLDDKRTDEHIIIAADEFKSEYLKEYISHNYKEYKELSIPILQGQEYSGVETNIPDTNKIKGPEALIKVSRDPSQPLIASHSSLEDFCYLYYDKRSSGRGLGLVKLIKDS